MQAFAKAVNTSALLKAFLIILMCFLLQACSKKENSDIDKPSPGNTDAEFYVANILQSNMVVQRDKPFTIWGKATAGAKISVTASWNAQPLTVTTNTDGKWDATILAAAANSAAQTITIKTAGKADIVFSNILIGDVWVCSGQSNMVMPVAPLAPSFQGALNYEEEVTAANYPLIRMCTITEDRQGQPLSQFNHTPEWKVCSPATAGKMSAVGYFFARKLQTELNVPIGIIVSAVNGVSCQPWVNKEVFNADATLAGLYGGGSAGQLYNGMLNPLTQLAIKGFLWYQGENNWNDAPDKYAMLNAALIKGWRNKFDQGALPFYLVQLTPFAKDHNNEPDGGDPNLYDYALFKEGQAKIPTMVPGTGIVITNDVGEVLNHHPRNKKPVGERLALYALKNEYGKAVSPFAPTYKGHVQNGKTITISFDNADGLKTINSQALNQLFFVADGSMQFVKANAAINGNTIVLTIPDGMEKPGLFIRYAFTNTAVTNLQNGAGLPVASFRTDN